MRFVQWAPAALQDLEQLDDYYSDRDPSISGQILRKAVAAARFLADNPGAGERIPDRRFRKWSVRGTPYILFYRSTDEVLRIVRVIHAARDWTRLL